ncbi:MAG: polymerase LigD, polymerase domain protein [Frankiales bacterium]|jgi:DNA ligase D-like protein (predicted polymerase)|nr:polymerase LigD, polymerase domain protein [Frankiales bacterium]
MPSPFVEIEIDTPTGERVVKVSNPDRTYFPGLPEGRGRKIDLVEYYLAVGPGIVRALRERPTVLKRHPEGSESPPVYTKRVPKGAPPWVQTATVEFPSGRSATELCPVDVAHVAWAVQMSTFDFHPWPSRRDDVEHPDELRIDLDPMPGTGWADVVETAMEVEALYDELGLVAYPKTSGSKGMHVYLRVRPEYSFLQLRHAALGVAREIERRRPELATSKWWKEERGERVFLDFNRMARDQTIASAYSVRARPNATVSAPLTWAEVPLVTIEDFDIWTMRERFAELGDVHAAIDDVHHDLQPLLDLYEHSGEGDAPYPPQFPKMEGEPLRSRPSVAGPAAQKRAEQDAHRRALADADRDRTPARSRRPPRPAADD